MRYTAGGFAAGTHFGQLEGLQARMHDKLVGTEASFKLPCSADATQLLLGFVEEILEVSGSDVNEPERLEDEMKAAVEALCNDPGHPDGVLQATFNLVDGGIEIRLGRVDGDDPESAGAGHTVTVREA